ncbi:hypothetical protein SCLCIDRAFT_822342 [Scleroderma citrinum Foug A]|uniref:Uncharacterized protein n=1 Tax=Scleroderma citrinum Foug A TaxID=1036808 RepID=A0A0C3A639_9AGAM|nr:hypothetical protein SCLCIDRAFT_822342 [Scleroderma citrinum Foug A]
MRPRCSHRSRKPYPWLSLVNRTNLCLLYTQPQPSVRCGDDSLCDVALVAGNSIGSKAFTVRTSHSTMFAFDLGFYIRHSMFISMALGLHSMYSFQLF